MGAQPTPAKVEKEEKILTKRARRKLKNDKHAWPQHPNIKSPVARAKAYIRTAGLSRNVAKQLDPELDLHSPQVKFGRLLGSTDQRVRHEAVLQLKAYLKARTDVNSRSGTGGMSEMDLLKLWKGLWYTLYMADKVPVQEELSNTLASLLWSFAGTEEEDEFAGQAYLDMFGDDAVGYDDDEDDAESSDSDDGAVVLEEVLNTLHNDATDDDESHDDSDGGSTSEDSAGEEPLDEDEDMMENDEEENEMTDEEEENEESEEGENEEAEDLDDSEVPHCRGAHLASLFVRVFLRTVRREWGKMDKYRVDKFYTLVRLMIHEIYKYMSLRHWNLGIIRLFNDAVYEEVLSQVPNGLRYHVVDVSLEELAKVNAQAPMPLTEATFLDALEPYFALMQTGGGDDILQSRTVENILLKFLDRYSIISELDENGDCTLMMDQVHVGTVAQFIFDLASDGSTKQRYRKGLYKLHKTFMRRLKAAGRDVELNGEQYDADDMELANEEEEQENEVSKSESTPEPPHLDEVKEETASEVSEAKPKRKRKKKKTKKQNQEAASPPLDEKKGAGLAERNTPKMTTEKKEQKSVPPVNSGAANEEEIIITLKEQQDAKLVLQSSDRQKKNEETKEESSLSKTKKGAANSGKAPKQEVKRVKFDYKNRAISWKTSMKRLKTIESPHSGSAPQKGILLNKGQKPVIRQPTKMKRKKAIDYF